MGARPSNHEGGRGATPFCGLPNGRVCTYSGPVEGPPSPSWRTRCVEVAYLLALGFALSVVAHALRRDALPWVTPPSAYYTPCGETVLAEKGAVLSPEDAEALLRTSGVALVDIRSAEAYAEGHLPRARSLPVSSVAPTDPAALAALKEFRVILVYDEEAQLGRAEEFAGELRGEGVKDVRFISGGLQGWLGSGRAVEKGARP